MDEEYSPFLLSNIIIDFFRGVTVLIIINNPIFNQICKKSYVLCRSFNDVILVSSASKRQSEE